MALPALAIAVAGSVAAQEEKPMNFLVIMGDDIGMWISRSDAGQMAGRD